MNLTKYIKTKAIEIGFDLVGITSTEPVDPADRQHFQTWLNDGKAGELAFLYRNIDKRFDPRKLLTDAKSVICVAVKYELSRTVGQDCRIASFALYEDYHKALKENLFSLAKFIESQHLGHFHYKVCVDSVPLAERALARRAGIGFIGRNHMLINPKVGNCILLGELITTLELEPDKPIDFSPCADCSRCIDACPTKALASNGHLDASRCISYLTIEARSASLTPPNGNAAGPPPGKGEYPEVGRGYNYIFGCDECLQACPYSNCTGTSSPLLKARPELLNLTRQQILDMTANQFNTFFAGSGLLRLGLARLKRNCLALSPQQ